MRRQVVVASLLLAAVLLAWAGTAWASGPAGWDRPEPVPREAWPIIQVLAVVGAVAGALMTIGMMLRKAWRAFRQWLRVVNGVHALVRRELEHNGGHSMRDRVERIDDDLDRLREWGEDVDHRLDQIADAVGAEGEHRSDRSK